MNKNKLRKEEISLINLLKSLFEYVDICENYLTKRQILDFTISLNNRLKEIQELLK